MFSVSNNFGDIPNMMRDALEKEAIADVVKESRKEGLKSADSVEINLESEMRSLGVRPSYIRQQASRRLNLG